MSSAFQIVLACIIYGTSSGLSTLSSKTIFNEYGASPYYCIFLQSVSLLSVFAVVSIITSELPSTKAVLNSFKLNVPTFTELTDSKKIMPGLLIGLGNTAFAISGYYGVKYVSIPL